MKLKGYASTEEPVIELEVSPQTIRRDLNILTEQDFNSSSSWWCRPSSTAENSDYIERKQFFLSQKVPLLAKWQNVFQNGASLFIDIGTTPEAVASALLNHERLRIVTNNINAAHFITPK